MDTYEHSKSDWLLQTVLASLGEEALRNSKAFFADGPPLKVIQGPTEENPNGLVGFNKTASDVMRALCNDDQDKVYDLWQLSIINYPFMGSVVEGVKSVKLSAAQVSEYVNTDINLEWESLEQPFRFFCVQMPDTGPEAGHYLMGYKDDNVVIITSFGGRHDSAYGFYVLLKSPDCLGKTIEQTLSHLDEASPLDDFDTTRRVIIQRCFFNACLMMTNYGYVTCPDPQREKLEKERKTANRFNRRRIDRKLSRLPTVYSFAQHTEIKPVRIGGGGGAEEGEERREVRTHWRRGHWTRQPCGEGRSERKLVFRRPVLVRADRFAGEMSDTSAEYVK